VLAYGSSLIKNPPDPSRFANLTALQAVDKSGIFKDQKVAISPIKAGGAASVEADPLLSKDIRFLFEPNEAKLDQSSQENTQNLESIKRLVQISPGSTLLLRGHVDNAKIEDFRRKGGEALVRSAALSAMDLSKRRAGEIKRLLIERYGIDAKRIEVVGRGWEEPAGTNSDLNRRVEVQWFTIE
jgi:NitT/TauT family transport system substrate-binding protein